MIQKEDQLHETLFNMQLIIKCCCDSLCGSPNHLPEITYLITKPVYLGRPKTVGTIIYQKNNTFINISKNFGDDWRMRVLLIKLTTFIEVRDELYTVACI